MTSLTSLGCTEDTFTMFANTNADGASRDSGSDTVEECKTKCLSQTDCVGFDFTSSNQCWIHTNADNIAPGNRNTGRSGVDLYVRVPCQGNLPSTKNFRTKALKSFHKVKFIGSLLIEM